MKSFALLLLHSRPLEIRAVFLFALPTIRTPRPKVLEMLTSSKNEFVYLHCQSLWLVTAGDTELGPGWPLGFAAWAATSQKRGHGACCHCFIPLGKPITRHHRYAALALFGGAIAFDHVIHDLAATGTGPAVPRGVSQGGPHFSGSSFLRSNRRGRGHFGYSLNSRKSEGGRTSASKAQQGDFKGFVYPIVTL